MNWLWLVGNIFLSSGWSCKAATQSFRPYTVLPVASSVSRKLLDGEGHEQFKLINFHRLKNTNKDQFSSKICLEKSALCIVHLSLTNSITELWLWLICITTSGIFVNDIFIDKAGHGPGLKKSPARRPGLIMNELIKFFEHKIKV